MFFQKRKRHLNDIHEISKRLNSNCRVGVIYNIRCDIISIPYKTIILLKS